VLGGSTDITGGFGGMQIGYNWQMPGSQWVIGLEADVSGGDIGFTETDPVFGSASTSIEVMGTARGRLGFAVEPRTLIYGTGGFAWAHNRVEVDTIFGGFSSTRTHTGWAAGAGIEHAFDTNWTARVEYLHTSYSSQDYFNGLFDLKADTDQVRFGLNYLLH
jgi:outer membrane immunogenic protein